MPDWAQQLAIAIVGGVATLLVRWLYFAVFLPSLHRFAYKGAYIGDRWYATYSNGGTERWDLKQRGHTVTGTISAGSSRGRPCAITGTFCDRIFTGTYETRDRGGLNRGALSMLYVDGPEQLVGYVLAHGTGARSVLALGASQCICRRDDQPLDRSVFGQPEPAASRNTPGASTDASEPSQPDQPLTPSPQAP